MKFILFVEGYTEDKALPQFLKRWLDSQLPKAVGIKTVRFEGWSELIKDAPKRANMHLNGPATQDIIAVISSLDLYGPTFYPRNLSTPDEKYNWAKKDIERKVSQPKFYQFFAVHEVEAWLLSDPSLFPADIQRVLAGKIKPPETINFDEPPAKLLERLYPLYTRRNFKKVVHGKELFGKLDPNLAYGKCPKLKELLDKMLELAIQSTQ
jgi:hypothetical protein